MNFDLAPSQLAVFYQKPARQFEIFFTQFIITARIQQGNEKKLLDSLKGRGASLTAYSVIARLFSKNVGS
jgi:hypothetical protein